jgi:CBS domain-containing protein
MKVKDIMTTPVVTVAQDCPVRQVAALMRDQDIGALPVMKNGDLVGLMTDRDIVLKLIAAVDFESPKTARDVMTSDVRCCRPHQTIEEIAGLMGDHQIRRLPVIDDAGALVGMISISDIAEHVSELLAGEALGEIVEDR